MITVNTKVDSCKENLAKLNVDYKWIPGENDVRPTPEGTNLANAPVLTIFSEIQRKHYHMAYIRQTFATEADFVLKMTLGLPSKRVKGLHVVNRTDLPRKKVFQENMFPYQVCLLKLLRLTPQTQGKHYIMWYTYTPPDEEITKDIDEAIQEIVGHANYKFVWYVNPKMTIPEVFHVQVFWTTE